MILIAQKKGKRVGGKAPIEVQISEEDADLACLKWSHSIMANGMRYVHRHSKEGHIYLSRVILGRVLARSLARSEYVNFIDGNPLNCQRHNLRIATHAQTLAHRSGLQRNNTSGYKGVFWLKDEGRWVAEISTNKTKIRLGRFDDKHEAAKAYNAAALAYHGEFAVLNSIPSVKNEFSALSKTHLKTS